MAHIGLVAIAFVIFSLLTGMSFAEDTQTDNKAGLIYMIENYF